MAMNRRPAPEKSPNQAANPARPPRGKSPATAGRGPGGRAQAGRQEEAAKARPKRKMSRISRQLSAAGLALRKGLGQNFLVNQGALEKIAIASQATSRSLVLEIGCGLGNLTELLAARAGRVLAVELDERFRPLHERELGHLKNVDFLYADFMLLPLAATLESALARSPELAGDVRIVGNIPYHLTSPILFKVMASRAELAMVGLLMQREVAHRLAARPGRRDYGILAAKANVRYQADVAFSVSPGSFMPPPRIHSAFARLTPRPGGALIEGAQRRLAFFSFIDAAFAQRRKMLVKSLSAASAGRLEREQIAEGLKAIGIEENVRGEELRVEQLLALFAQLGEPDIPSVRKSYEEVSEP